MNATQAILAMSSDARLKLSLSQIGIRSQRKKLGKVRRYFR
jgi:hypothetical protein